MKTPSPASEAAVSLQMITVMGLGGDVRWVSPSITQLLGWPFDAVDQGVAFDLVHPDDHRAIVAAVIAAAGGSLEQSVEHRMLAADGQFVPVRSTVQRMPAGDEQLLLVVTEAAGSVQKFAEIQSRYTALVERSQEAIVVHIDCMIVAASPAVGAVLHTPAEG